MIPNSAWKDYSAANTNYAFDSLEDEKKQINGKNRSETLPPPKSGRNIQRPQGRPPSVPPQNPGYMADTRSLQRPRGPYQGNLERSTFSLPRTTYDRSRSASDMQPTFILCLLSESTPEKWFESMLIITISRNEYKRTLNYLLNL